MLFTGGPGLYDQCEKGAFVTVQALMLCAGGHGLYDRCEKDAFVIVQALMLCTWTVSRVRRMCL